MTKRNFRIREATVSDIEQLVELQLNTALETEGVRLEKTTVDKGVKAVFQDPSKRQYYIAEKSGQPIGCLLVVPEWSDWRNGTILWIHSIYVIPGERRQGVLRKLYEHLQSLVNKSPHLLGLRTLIDKGNLRGLEAARALGMKSEHYETYEWLKE